MPPTNSYTRCPAPSRSARQDADPKRMRDDDFAYGLDRILDGLAARLDVP
jgi:hypothetical protein